MTIVAHFLELARNNSWSNHRLHRACARLSESEYRAARTGFFPSIPATLSHILTVDWYYLDALEHGGRGYAVFEKDEPFTTLGELTAAQRQSDRRLIAYCERLTSKNFADIVVLDRGAQGRFEETVQAVLTHLFVHQIHHRGQAHAMLSGTSVKPPQLDEFFLIQDLPLRADELRALSLPLH
jgi:uncharacterized damage-inducible protein DinB